uniref:protein mono-ADP-ribosyltransferase PARP12-like n=1 Tax=Centroberyx gerrardi TaxID=166262 RepID=UPI003AAE22B4
RVSLQSSSAEYQEIESLFCDTMRGFDIVQIERIQNKALWEVFEWQKDRMKKNNSGQNVTERKLFHGTDSKHVDAICLDNFDWRICGTHGTSFGKGSYFARDAKYSHRYTGQSDAKSMFVSRVLVGDFTRGSSDYLRPPSKDGEDTRFYDSCVDDVRDPSIFVVFEKHQIYPEYLLQYEEKISNLSRGPSTRRSAPCLFLITPSSAFNYQNTAANTGGARLGRSASDFRIFSPSSPLA